MDAACPTFAYCTAYAAGTVVTYNGSNYTATYAISNTRDCSAYTPATDNWWAAGGTCGSATPTATRTPTATATTGRSTATATRTNTATATATGGSGLSSIVTSTIFNQLVPSSSAALYKTYSNFITAGGSYPAFCGNDGSSGFTNSTNDYKRECAAAFAQWQHETGNFVYTDEQNPPVNWYCLSDGDCNTSGCCASGVEGQYWGRGAIQISHCFNYKAVGTALGISTWTNPSSVTSDATVMWKTALWYWMTQAGPALSGWPSVPAHTAVRKTDASGNYGFGAATRAINGALECAGHNTAQMQDRILKYNGSGSYTDEDGSGGTLGIFTYGGAAFGRKDC